MNNSTIVIIIYIVGIIFGAIFLGLWDAQTGPLKAMGGMIWTAIFLIALFYCEKKDN